MIGSMPDLTKIIAALQAHGQTIGEACALRVAAHAPVGTSETAGRLRDSLQAQTEDTGDGIHITITSDAPEAVWVIEGTRAHDIYPREKKALFWEGAEHPYAHVHHPGNRPNPFAEQATDEIYSEIADEVPIIVAEAVGS